MNKRKNRDQEIDIYKGIGIILVVLGHAIQRTYDDYTEIAIFKAIYSFHMPLFMFSSGLLLRRYMNRSPDIRWLVVKAKRLLIPFLVWLPIEYYFSQYEFSGLKYCDYSVSLFNFIILAISKPGGTWYFVVLFECIIVYYMERKLNGLLRINYAWLFLVPAMIFLGSIINYCSFPRLGRLIIFFYFGYILETTLDKIIVKNNIFGIILTLHFLLLIFIISFRHWPFNDGWPISLFCNDKMPLFSIVKKINMLIIKTIVGMVGVLLCVIAAKAIMKEKHLSNIICYVGMSSLEIYVLHRMFLGLGFGHGVEAVLTRFLICISIACFLQWFINEKYYLRYVRFLLFGK